MYFILKDLSVSLLLTAEQVSKLTEVLLGTEVLKPEWQSRTSSYVNKLECVPISEMFQLRMLSQVEYNALKMHAANSEE